MRARNFYSLNIGLFNMEAAFPTHMGLKISASPDVGLLQKGKFYNMRQRIGYAIWSRIGF